MAEQTYSWAYSLVDSSQVSTFLISILLIVYGSFRSLNMDFENQDKEKDSNSSSGSFNGNSTNNSIQTIDSTQALFLPIGASVSLLVMFFFFDSVQVVFTICTAVLATIAFAFLLLPMCQYLTRPCSPQNKISFGCCGRFTAAELLSFSLSVMLVLIWVLTGHWLLMDALAMGLCVAMIAFVRLPSLKVSCLLLSGLLIYDVFWVFFSAYIFNSNVMVKVATQPADNPLDVLSRKLHLGPNVGRDVPRLSLPGKLVFPSSTGSHFSMLGIGDIVMPGLLLCFVLRYDNYKKQANSDSCSASGPANISGRMQKVSYFHCTLIGYFVDRYFPSSALTFPSPLTSDSPSASFSLASSVSGRQEETVVIGLVTCLYSSSYDSERKGAPFLTLCLLLKKHFIVHGALIGVGSLPLHSTGSEGGRATVVSPLDGCGG
ncbi:signal peptide peptidase-like 3 isoform X1 [Physeter macrocephalus]|uniref:Signal peptide peptidase-like 3 isoform X1 n=1 Tax=Physeter macrocephalus TaxID=9755 RepID=A0A455AJS6_PHYMC|nr:signal peptide peptidase-like 3 isoform X1 [Physeter catodon]|eukprot:XP_028336103.1 signal peptide peptidase-like 3 isoform X1 [Physeter catodon]